MYTKHVLTSYLRLKRFCAQFEPVLLLDVSRGDTETDVPTIRFDGERLKKMGLEMYPPNRWAWFAGDYALYSAILDNSDFSHYLMIDYDVHVNFPVNELVLRAMEGGFDLVAPYAGFEDPAWMWAAAGRHWFSRVAGCFFPVVMLSRRLILRCLEVRLNHSRSLPHDDTTKQTFLAQNWMNCEAFVPSVALESGFSMIDIDKLVSGWSYKFFRDVDVLHWEMPEIAQVPCAHPVFLKDDLPAHIAKKLHELPEGKTRSWFVDRVNSLLKPDGSLWREITEKSPELDG